jgi:dienelactone hydrolase
MIRTILAVLALAPLAASAAPVAKPVIYKIGDVEFQSTLVYDDSSKTPRPGLVMAPNWFGANEASIEKAKTIAGKDYVILLADVYGKDVRPKNADEAGAAVKKMYADRSVLRTRINRVLDALRASAAQGAPLDGKHFGAVGFCFGGATVLDLGRSGADVAGIVTFHGNLATDDAKLAKNIKGKVLTLNGADDSYVPADQIAGFEKEMKDAGVDYQFVNLSGAVHCFAEPDQNSPPGCVYHERSAKRAYKYMHDFFDEVFASRP